LQVNRDLQRLRERTPTENSGKLKGLIAGNTAIHLGRWANPPHSQNFSDHRNQSEAMSNGSINNHLHEKGI
jgi:hypothetical protein